MDFSENGGIYEINPTEYIKDLMHYKEKAFDFDETKDVFNLIASLLEKAIKKGVNVKAKRVQFGCQQFATPLFFCKKSAITEE